MKHKGPLGKNNFKLHIKKFIKTQQNPSNFIHDQYVNHKVALWPPPTEMDN